MKDVGPGAARRGGEGVRGQKKKTKFGVYAAGPSLSWQVLACLLRLWRAATDRRRCPSSPPLERLGCSPRVPRFVLIFQLLFFFRFFFASFRNWGSGSGTGFFFSFNFVISTILAIVFSAKTRAKLTTPTYNYK